MGKTLYDKIVGGHTVCQLGGDRILLYVDFHVMNEYTSPQAFSGLQESGRTVLRPSAHLGVVDHVNPTKPIVTLDDLSDNMARIQISNLVLNCKRHNIQVFDLFDARQGIEHVVVPEIGLAQPGMVILCGDSHTTTYGAFGALGFGIGTSEIEHVLATQTLVYRQRKTMRVHFQGGVQQGVTAKDLVMAFIARVGASGAAGYVVEFQGEAIRSLSVEARMTLCNMAVEAGAGGALVAPDEKVFEYLQGRPHAPQGDLWDQALTYWKTLFSDVNAHFDTEVQIKTESVAPQVTWGTSPDQCCAITDKIPDPAESAIADECAASAHALEYMDLAPGMAMCEISINKAFIGSCTNGRIEDLRQAAQVVNGHRIASTVQGIVVPGSHAVRRQAEKEGLAQIFLDAGFEWRNPGCSMCLAMNDDVLAPGDRCASSTNRNFEGRQGLRARTHLMSPAMVAAAAVAGHLCDFRELKQEGIDETV